MKKDILSLIPGILGFAIIPFLNGNEIAITVLLLALMGATFLLKYHKNELYLFAMGCVIGFIVEWYGDSINQLQFWQNASFFGLPLWLPIFWGFGFIYIRRIGNLVVR